MFVLTKHLLASDKLLNQTIQLLFVSEFSKTRDVDIKCGPLLSAAACAQPPPAQPPHPDCTRWNKRKRGRETDREGGVAFIYVLAMQKDDFSSFERDDLAECSGAQSQRGTEDDREDGEPCEGGEGG